MCNFFSALGMRDGSIEWHPMLLWLLIFVCQVESMLEADKQFETKTGQNATMNHISCVEFSS